MPSHIFALSLNFRYVPDSTYGAIEQSSDFLFDINYKWLAISGVPRVGCGLNFAPSVYISVYYVVDYFQV